MKKFLLACLIMSVFISISVYSQDKIQIGTFEFPKGKPDYLENVFKKYQQLGIDRVYYHINVKTIKLDENLFRIASKYKIELIPILNTYACAGVNLKKRNDLKPEIWAQIFSPSGKIRHAPWGYDYPCILAPSARKIMKKEVEEVIKQGNKLGLRTIALDDEFGLWLGWQGDGWTDFNKYCVNYFKKKTGLNPPEVIYQKPGIVDEKSPLYKWIMTIGYPSWSGPLKKFHNVDLLNTAKKINSDIKVVQMPGGEYGELDAVVVELYQYMFYAPETAACWQMDYARHSQESSPQKPIWPLIGWYQKTPFPDWIGENIKLTAKLALAWGAKSIDFACIPLMDRKTFPFSNRKDLENSYILLIKEIRKIQNLLVKLKPEQKPVAILFSNTTEAYQKILDWEKAQKLWEEEKIWSEKPWEHIQSFDMAFSSLLLAHIPVEIITEKEILEGKLKNYRALILIDCQYLPSGVYRKIQEFKKSGKEIFADKSCFIVPEGSILLPVDFSIWSKMIESGFRRKCWQPEETDNHFFQWKMVKYFVSSLKRVKKLMNLQTIKISSPYIIYNVLTDGKSDYIFLINTDLKNSHKTEVKLQGETKIVEDVIENKKIKETENLKVEIKKADWKILKIIK